MQYSRRMSTSHLTLRLTRDDATLIEHLQARTGMTKSAVVKHALRSLAANLSDAAPAVPSLYSLGEAVFGRYGDVTRQSVNVKQVVRDVLRAKHKA